MLISEDWKDQGPTKTRKIREDNEWEKSALTEQEKEQERGESLYWKFATSCVL